MANTIDGTTPPDPPEAPRPSAVTDRADQRGHDDRGEPQTQAQAHQDNKAAVRDEYTQVVVDAVSESLTPDLGAAVDTATLVAYLAHDEQAAEAQRPLDASEPLSGDGRQTVDSRETPDGGEPASNTPRADAMRERRPENRSEPAWNRICDGIAFNEVREPYYTERGGGKEIRLENGKVLDSYVPRKEIVSRKETQLAKVQEGTAAGYLQEVVSKYSPGEVVADTPHNRRQLPDEIGRESTED